MATLKDFIVAGKNCDKQMWKMCKDRSQHHRKCVLPRCCVICYKIRNCEGVCIYLRKKFKNDLS